MTEVERKAAWHQANREKRLAAFRARYQAKKEAHKASVKAHYYNNRLELLAQKQAYRRTAAGMLASARHHAKERGH